LWKVADLIAGYLSLSGSQTLSGALSQKSIKINDTTHNSLALIRSCFRTKGSQGFKIKPDHIKIEVMRLIDNLYAYLWQGNDNNCNSYVFAGVLKEGKHVVIDPGHVVTPVYREPGLAPLFESMSQDGLSADSIGMVILTHGHPDHCEAAAKIQEDSGTLVALHEADEPLYRMLGGKADVFLQEGTLELGSGKTTRLQIFHSPGHTPGHVTIYWPHRKVLIAGDCVFYRSTGRTDFPGGNASSLKKSIDRLSRLDIEYLLCGHAYGSPGILEGREAVRENFGFIQTFIINGAL
jgi:hydroxyacylglutathione hydrolase